MPEPVTFSDAMKQMGALDNILEERLSKATYTRWMGLLMSGRGAREIALMASVAEIDLLHEIITEQLELWDSITDMEEINPRQATAPIKLNALLAAIRGQYPCFRETA